MIEEPAWEAALVLLRPAASVVVSGHVNPDGDALGSVLALALALRRRGVTVAATFPEPFVVPTPLQTLPGQELLVPPGQVAVSPDAFVAVDTASPARLGQLYGSTAARAGAVLLIDHHASNAGFGDVALLDPAASASGVVVAGLIDRLPVSLDKEIATCLYAAVASDTGSFRFGNTTPEAHRLAARLLEAGVAHDELSRSLFDTRPPGWLPMLAAVLARTHLEPAALDGDGLVWTAVLATDRERNDLPFDQAESVVDVIRTTENVGVAVVFKEQEAGVWSVSLRSRGRRDVGAAAIALGGGGHRLAAGYTEHGPLDEAVARLRSVLDSA